MTPIHEVFQNTIPKELSTVLAVAVYATEQKELLPKMAIGVKTYEFSATTVVSDQSINVYVRDVTAENVISRLPDRNPVLLC